MAFIYYLYNTENNKIFYVGRTGSVEDRRRDHKRNFNNINFVVIEECEDDKERERLII